MNFCDTKSSFDCEELPAHLIRKVWGEDRKLNNPYQVIVHHYNHVTARFETNMMMHKLTAEYYGNRAFWLTYLPLLLVTTAVSICSFLSTGEYDDSMVTDENLNVNTTSLQGNFNSEGGQEFLSILIGVFGVLSTFLASLGKYLNYQSRADMHLSATNTLKDIIEELDYQLVWLKSRRRIDVLSKTDDKDNKDEPDDKEAKEEQKKEELQKLQFALDLAKSNFSIMEKSCTSLIPDQIKHAFICLDEHCKLIPRTVRYDHYRRYYNDLNDALRPTGFCCCLRIPKINVPLMFGSQIMREVDAIHEKLQKRKAIGQSEEDGGKSEREALFTEITTPSYGTVNNTDADEETAGNSGIDE